MIFTPEKSIYKKATGDGWSYNPDTARAKENKFFDEISNDKVAKKKKTPPKTVERADHKHEYAPAIVWRNGWIHKERKVFYTTSVCPVCGREEGRRFRNDFRSEFKREIPYLGELPHFESVEGDEKLVKIEGDEYAKKIFLGGSKSLDELSVEIKNALTGEMHANATFLIGDGTGADLLTQKFLAKNGYRKVVVYTAYGKAKINVGFWEEKQVNGYQGQDKTAVMESDADEGFMLFKGHTHGAMASVERLVSQGKICKVAFKRKPIGNIIFREIYEVEKEGGVEWLKRELDEITPKN